MKEEKDYLLYTKYFRIKSKGKGNTFELQ